MKPKYMIVKISERSYTAVDDPCYKIISMDYETLETACKDKEKYSDPYRHIVVQYW